MPMLTLPLCPQNIAEQHNIAIVLGYAERVGAGEEDPGTLFNSAVLIDAKGQIVHNHRKAANSIYDRLHDVAIEVLIRVPRHAY